MNTLILDIKTLVALVDQRVWIKLVIYDKEFKNYAYTKQGIKQFVNTFHRVVGGTTYLLYHIHSIDDKPGVIYDDGEKRWYYKGKFHRENDLPAIIQNDNKQWYYDGMLHRENDLPAVMYNNNGDKHWYYKGKPHRNNDLPTFIYGEKSKQFHW